MSAVINLTTHSPEGGGSGFSSDGLLSGTTSFGSVSPGTVDGKTIGALFWAFASHGNASVELFLEYTGSPPPDDYVSGLSFVGDNGTNDLSPATQTALETGTSGALYKVWLFNASSGLPDQSDPFTANGNVYAITVSTQALALTATPVSDSEIDLSWTDTSNTANNYSLTRDNVAIESFANSVFSFHDTGLASNTTYEYAITGLAPASSFSFT